MRMEVNMGDRFKELSTMAMKELTEVFDRMDDSNVRELLEMIKKTDRIFLLAAGRPFYQVICNEADASGEEVLLDLGRHNTVHRERGSDDLCMRFCQRRT